MHRPDNQDMGHPVASQEDMHHTDNLDIHHNKEDIFLLDNPDMHHQLVNRDMLHPDPMFHQVMASHLWVVGHQLQANQVNK